MHVHASVTLIFLFNSARKALENRSTLDDSRVELLEMQFKEAQLLAEQAEQRYDEVLAGL